MLSEAQAYNPPENVVSMGETLSPNASYGRIVGKKLRIWPDNFRLARHPLKMENAETVCQSLAKPTLPFISSVDEIEPIPKLRIPEGAP